MREFESFDEPFCIAHVFHIKTHKMTHWANEPLAKQFDFF